MKFLILVYLLLINSIVISQSSISLYVEPIVHHSTNVVKIRGFSTLKFGVRGGIKVDFSQGTFQVGIFYSKETNVRLERWGEVRPSFTFYNNTFGAEFNYIFLNKGVKFRPILSCVVATSVNSNYKDGFLIDGKYYEGIEYSLTPSAQKINTPSSSHNEPGSFYYTSDFYQSTPFIFSLMTGCNIRLTDNLYLNLLVGYGLRMMKTKNMQWSKGEDVYQKLGLVPTQTNYFHMLDSQLGLSYAFDIHKKKPKTTTP